MNSRSAHPRRILRLAPRLKARTAVRASWLVWPLSLLSSAMALVSVSLAVLNGRSLSEMVVDEIIVTIAILALAFSITGALIATHRPGNPVGWIFCAAALCQALIIFSEEYATYTLLTRPGSLPLGAAASWLKEWIWAPGLGLILVFLPLLFPDGRLPGPRWRWVAWLGALSTGLISALYIVLLWPQRGPALMQPGGEAEQHIAPIVVRVTEMVAFPMMLIAGLGAVFSLVVRFRRTSGDERLQIKWFASASVLTLAFIVVYEEVPIATGGTYDVLFVALSLLVVPMIPVATGIAILRYRLYDIDLIINRTLVYGALTACVIGIYVLIVGYLGAFLRTNDNLAISLVATGIVAVLFAPLRDRLQRGINRMMYGERDDPYGILSRLGQRLKATIEPAAVLPTIVETVAEALKLPYAAIALAHDGRYSTVAEWGKPSGEPLVLPLTHGTETIGELILSPRAPGEAFDTNDRRLLDDLARQSEVAVHAVRLTRDLQRSRARLVTAREEERRRLRRDLHDGLGPQLATLTLKLDAARNQIPHQPAVAEALLAELKRQTQGAIAEIRRLVYDLRPPALDDLGLIPALREQATSYSHNRLTILIEAPEPLPSLPAAVEVAAFRIVQEALTNVVRHAGARTCRVSFSLGDELHLQVLDDGIGLPLEPRAGVGLQSMRERAAELGGTCRVEPGHGGGTRVLASLPLSTGGVTL